MADIRKLMQQLMEQCSCAPATEGGSFESWMTKVKAEIKRISGMDSDDLPDVPYNDWYEDGVSPSRAASKAIKNAEMGESVGQPEGGNAVAEELSRKYYVAIAQILRDSENKDQIAKGLVQLFKSDNPRFDTNRFMRAAGFGLEPVVADKAPMAQQQINKDVDRAARDFEYEKKWGKPR
jgi:hypothetical protein